MPVVVLGEALLDLLVPQAGIRLAEATTLTPCLGGAPANVAVQVARLGGSAVLLTAVGDDPFGTRLVDELAREGVDTSMVTRRAGHRTGLTFIQVDADAERHFFPWRENAADQTLTAADLPPDLIEGAGVLHRGTVSLCDPRVRGATDAAVARARAAGVWVSLDVNLRYGMFKSRDELLSLARDATHHADIIKAARQEAVDLLGSATDDALVDAWLAQGARLVCLTLDKEGALLATPDVRVRVPTPDVREVDATGAGDAFVGALLACVQRLGRIDLAEAELDQVGRFACGCGAAAITALGATAGMRRGPLPV